MGVMTVTAGDTGGKHLALLERAIVIDLVAHLPVRMVEPGSEEGDGVRVGQGLARRPVLGKFTTSRVA